MITSRRSFILGTTALIAAPAIVRASSLMKVRGAPIPNDFSVEQVAQEIPKIRWALGLPPIKQEGYALAYDFSRLKDSVAAEVLNQWN